MQIQTSRFETSHGRKPRGTGGWWFELSNSTRPTAPFTYPTKSFFFNGAFAEARRAAKVAAAAGAFTVINVLP